MVIKQLLKQRFKIFNITIITQHPAQFSITLISTLLFCHRISRLFAFFAFDEVCSIERYELLTFFSCQIFNNKSNTIHSHHCTCFRRINTNSFTLWCLLCTCALTLLFHLTCFFLLWTLSHQAHSHQYCHQGN